MNGSGSDDGPPRRRRTGPTGRRRRTAHWTSRRKAERESTREAIAVTIAVLDAYPTTMALLRAGKGRFSRSSLGRHSDLIDAAQASFNARLVASGQAPMPVRKGGARRPDGTLERALEAERLLEIAEDRIAGLEGKVAGLNDTVARLLRLVARDD